MVKNFYRDLENSYESVEQVINTLQPLTFDYVFYPTGLEYQHKGDIGVLDLSNSKVHYIEVKDDSRIAQTHNVLCEEAVYYHESDTEVKGNMYSDYEYYCVVSQQEQKLYIIDFKGLKKIYRNYTRKLIPHEEQTTIAFLVPLGDLRKQNMIIAECGLRPQEAKPNE